MHSENSRAEKKQHLNLVSSSREDRNTRWTQEVLGLLCTSLPGTGCSGPEPSALSLSCRCRSWLPALPPPRGTELTHTHHFSLSSPGEGAPVDFSNPSSLFPIIVCEPRGTAAIDSPRLCCDARNQLGSLPLPGAALGWEQVWGTLGDQSLWGGCERRYRPHGFI